MEVLLNFKRIINMDAPKVFVSHASEDKDRFVMGFATQLRQKGVDAWVDKWEIKVGDSLVKKIFDEGLTSSDAIIIVLSSISVEKPWVKEELDFSVVRKINEGTRIIPVVIDKCNIPAALKSTKWVKVEDLNSYDDTIDEIISTIFGANDKPPIGKPPVYVSSLTSNSGVGNHNNIDSYVTKLICQKAIEIGHHMVGELPFIKDGQLVLPKEQLRDSLEYLYEVGTIKWQKDLSGSFFGIQISVSGFEMYAKEYIEGYHELKLEIISLIVNQEITNNVQIRALLNCQQFLVDHVLRLLENQGNIKVMWFLGGQCLISNVSASFKRSLR